MEDALLAQLRNSTLEEYDDKDRIEPETDEEEQDVKDEAPLSRDAIRSKGPQTGPKGVKADYDYYQRIKAESTEKARQEYNARILAKAPMTTTFAEDQQELILEYKEEDSDEEVIKVFGYVSDVNSDNYIEAIDNEWKTVPIIVHIYSKQIPACEKLDEYLIALAKKYTLAKFIRISAIELDFDLVGSPTVLAYQGGILIANLVRIMDEVGYRFDVESIEDVLLRHGALSDNDLYEQVTHENTDDDDYE
ncbi:hypothetical protein RO3G_10266 [Rhizopus delemar RA 99-880]|uniref:Phosducin domain-containing protein n=1 Tax=Rhizopus delemar (strain RA 99-880 / ATCC MYA-4621 / FGSC 9543 / NRRL 43880) TaxID=246409 RepID=I1CAS6_RHIO9|nr:hypothetical protein RO3G_10266 [Rhizopus delemar RA 99-880]|eukprot:EIE85556.1 hypothetical protein RO3G_10266 [Rhizopus delemar RA 99-880]